MTTRRNKKANPVKSSRRATPKTHVPAARKTTDPTPPFVVGIGASAGGIEAFSSLLEHLPDNLGMSYIFLLHQAPSKESYLQEILSRKTKMKVRNTVSNTRLAQNTVYVVMPGQSIAVTKGKFRTKSTIRKAANFHTIDSFLTSLADVYKEKTIGIVLSGTATDGTLGLKSIKEAGGITFAQDHTARHPGMPQHAAEMGYADFVMSPEKIAGELEALVCFPYPSIRNKQSDAEYEVNLRHIHTILHSRKNVDFSHYKQTTIHRRILRRMVLSRLKNLGEYVSFLRENIAETDALYQDLLITVTNFFRDINLYNSLANKILPVLLKNRKPGDPVRIWIPGCATGEEAVSFAIVLLEYLGEKAITTPIQIFATDLNTMAIERSRSGLYPKSAVQNLSPQRLKRFFVKKGGSYQVVKAIRDICVFAPHNLLKDPPFSRMDIISCQNLLIYLEPAPQNRIMHAFHYALKPAGYLLLGKSETTGSASDLFEQAEKEAKIYTRKAVSTPLQMDFPIRHSAFNNYQTGELEKQMGPGIPEIDLEKETEKMLLTRYVPPSVLVNKDLDILRFRGSISRYLEPSAGKASLHLMKMIKEEIVFELRSLIHRARKSEQPVRKEGLMLDINGSTGELAIEVNPLKGNGKNLFFLIVFTETPSRKPSSSDRNSSRQPGTVRDRHIASLETQLKETRANMKIMAEEFEATREELQSSNEEVLSSNEELQSINEELETSKEELQSTNEELTTINEELQHRNIELKETSQYAKSIVETMHESLLILSDDFRIRTANKGFYNTFQTTAAATEGYYLYELGNNQWDLPELNKHLKLLQSRNLGFANFEMEHVFPHIGKKIMLLNAHRVALQNGKDSVIILAIQDITGRKLFEEQLMAREERFRLLIQNAFDIITVLDANGDISYISPAVESVLGYRPEERIGKNVIGDGIIHPDDQRLKEDMIRKVVANPEEMVHSEFRLLHKNGSYRTIDAVFRNQLEDEKIRGIVATYRDVTERKLLEQQKDEFIGIASHELKTPVTSLKAYAQLLQEKFKRARDRKSATLLGKMNMQIDRLTMLIVDLLDFTRIEGGKLKFREDRYEINDLVTEVTEEMQRTTPRHTIIRKQGRATFLLGDRYRTGQVITNLLSNAIKYSPAANKIVVTVARKAGEVTICVQDFGIGIDKEQLTDVFTRFFRVSDSSVSTFPGLGLGLYIASEIIQRQGGKIWVKSARGKGSTFCFSLPIAAS